MKRKLAPRHRGFVFTSFHPDRPKRHLWMRFMCSQQETCPETGSLHWQGYVYLDNAMTLSAFIQAHPWHKNIHIEGALGSPSDNVRYCSKSETAVRDTFLSEGEPPHPGLSSSLYEAATQVLAGGLAAVEDPTMIIRFHRGLTELKRVRAKHNWEKKTVKWFYGSTGTGKTESAMKHEDAFITSSRKWYCGYEGQKTLIIDDLQKDEIPLSEILRMLDRYPYVLQVKNGSAPLVAKTIIITSRYHPHTYFPPDRYPEVARRIDQIVQYPIVEGEESSITSSPLCN